MRHLSFGIALALLLAACGGRQASDMLDLSRQMIGEIGDDEPCAQEEYAAARRLLAQAEAAYQAREYRDARRYAEAAQAQMEVADRVAAENAENCDRIRTFTEIVSRDNENDPSQNNAGSEVIETAYEFETIYFDYDSSELSPQARATLDAHARELSRNPGWRLVIEGHCDTRGEIAYNLALGNRRARSVMAYLERAGVSSAQLSTLSYGAERPISNDHGRNRRAEFSVRSR